MGLEVHWLSQAPTSVGNLAVLASEILRTSGSTVHMFMMVVSFLVDVLVQRWWTLQSQEHIRFLDREGDIFIIHVFIMLLCHLIMLF